jgi:hypothetical protein
MDNESLQPPQPSLGDVMHLGATTVAGLASLVGVVGAGEAFKFFFASPMEKRTQKWMQNMADAVIELQQRSGVDIQTIQENEEFLTLLIQATQIAYKTHLEAKHQSLKKALMNSYASELDFDRKQVLMSLIDTLTVTHILLLQAVKDYGRSTIGKQSIETFHNTVQVLGNLQNKAMTLPDFIDFLTDLEQRALIEVTPGFLDVGQSKVDRVQSLRVRTAHSPDEGTMPLIGTTKLASDLIDFIN